MKAVRHEVAGCEVAYAAFAQGPEAIAVQGALDLNTLVVTPAGNDGNAGPTFGSVAGPAGAPGALAVGATDARSVQPRVRVVLRSGLNVILDRDLPLLGPVAPSHSLTLRVTTPRATSEVAGASSVDYFDKRGFSLVELMVVIGLIAVAAMRARGWFLQRMDAQLSARDAGDAGAVRRLRRLHWGGMLCNALLLAAFVGSIPYAASA